MPTTPVEQADPAGNASSAPLESAQSAESLQTGLTKTAYDAVPSLADAIKARMAGSGSRASSSTEEKTSASTDQPVVDASSVASSGQTSTVDSDTSTDGTAQAATPASTTEVEKTPAAEPKKLSRSQRRAENAKKRDEATAAGTPLPADAEEDDDDFLVSEVQRAVQPLAAQVQELASAVTSVTRPAPMPPDVVKLNEQYVDKFGDDATFSDLADIKVKNSRALSLEEDERLATWAENRLVRELQTQRIQRDVSAVALGVASQRGVNAETITGAPNLASAFEAFYTAGQQAGQTASATAGSAASQAAIQAETVKQQELTAQLTALTASNEELKRTNQQISDELEALQKRAPAFARQTISGGMASLSSTPGGVTPLDPSRQTGKQMLIAAAQNRARQQTGAGPALRNR